MWLTIIFFPGTGHRKDVRLQEARKKAHKKEKRRSYGAYRKTDSSKNQFSFRCELGLRLRDERCPLSSPDHHERGGPEISHI